MTHVDQNDFATRITMYPLDVESKQKATRIARNGFLEIANTIRDEITAGTIPSGAYLPTERELQDRFGASRATIRKSLASLVDDGWGVSIPNKGVMAARGLRLSNSREFALIDGGLAVPRVLETGLTHSLASHGYQLLRSGARIDVTIEDALRRAIETDALGAVVWPYRGFPDAEQIREVVRRMPILALDHALNGVEMDLVTFDYEAATFLATQQLIQQRCRRIGITGMLDMLETTHQRFRGYMRAMFAHGLQPLPIDYVFVSTSGIGADDTSGLEQQFRSGDRPDGLVVMQESHVPSVVDCLLRCGLSLPYDLKLVAVGDDIDVVVDDVALTAVALDWEALTQLAVKLLLERIDDLQAPPKTRYAPHSLKVRGSCGAPKSEWTDGLPAMPTSDGRSAVKSQFRYSSNWRRHLFES